MSAKKRIGVKDRSKVLAMRSLNMTKKIIANNKHSRKAAIKFKKVLLTTIGDGQPKEIYNLYSFYPTIEEYYYQTKDICENDPLISILLPTYNTPEIYLRECIESIIVQSYANWELCISDDNSTDKNVLKTIKEYQQKDNRIKLVSRKTNGHISEATNSALEIANGKFVALMDHDDVLWPNALYENIQIIRDNKKVDFIYSDEDKIDGTGKIHSYPFLKPDFSPEFLESCNYITHFSCIRTDVIKKVGGFRKGYEGAQDWDLFIRIGEITNNIVHIPKLLYSWRIHENSTASNTDAKPYVYEAQKKLLNDHLARLKLQGVVETGIITQHRTINYFVAEDVIFTLVIKYSSLENTKKLIESINKYPAGLKFDIIFVFKDDFDKTEWSEILYLLPNKSSQKIILNPKNNWYKNVAINSNNEYIIFIDDKLEVHSDNWAKRLIADLSLVSIGIVSPVILDHTAQNVASAGIGVGYGQKGLVDMLSGMPFNDPHYTRGLYAKSRRNVSVVNPAMFSTTKTVFKKTVEDNNFFEICLDLLNKGYRNIYNPYSKVILQESVSIDINEDSTCKIGQDKYLNPNFNHKNQNMEVRP